MKLRTTAWWALLGGGMLLLALRRARGQDAPPLSEADIDETLEDSFPASDAPSWTPTTGPQAQTPAPR